MLQKKYNLQCLIALLIRASVWGQQLSQRMTDQDVIGWLLWFVGRSGHRENQRR